MLLALASTPALAAPCATTDADPALPACAALHASHALDVSLAAGVIAAGGDDGAFATTSARADASYTLGIGRDIDVYAFAIAAGVTARRTDGTVDTFGGATRLSLDLGPVPPPPAIRYLDRAVFAPFPLSFSIAHDGELAALPGLAQAADVARGAYSTEHVEVRTRALRIAGVDTHPDQPPRPITVDLFPVHGELDATLQDGTRLAETAGAALVEVDFPAMRDARLELVAADAHVVHLPDGTTRRWSEVWPLRAQARSPLTGTVWHISWGLVDDPMWGSRNLFAFGVGTFDTGGIMWERRPYITMTGVPAMEDRISGELVIGTDLHLVARAFAARTERAIDAMTTRVDWTAGVDGDGATRVGPVDVGLRVEVGRSYYAALDDGAPSAPGFGARAAVTVSRAIAHRYTR